MSPFPVKPLDLGNFGFSRSSLDRLIRQALQEDGARQDRTTLAVVGASQWAKGEIRAKGPGVLAGLPLVASVLRRIDPRCRVEALRREGQEVRAETKVARLSGPARALLSGERLSLNFLSRLSGIATLTRRFREKLGVPKLYDTRKTTPLLRPLERYAVRVGGGKNHRYNLAGHVLIKDNHLALGGGVSKTVTAARKKYGPKEFIEVEVESLGDALAAVEAGADLILVDNASPKLFREIIRRTRGRVQIETSGGLTLSTIGRYAHLPVDRFSSGALTHSAPSIDFSMALFPAGK
ncbi:MAG TPA: carboxylating nicotinate-nucleotide diphosphorylase [bacterium]|nr:carboxylating nicotinate-nucleotide diphosphorylase [bacterium]